MSTESRERNRLINFKDILKIRTAHTDVHNMVDV